MKTTSVLLVSLLTVSLVGATLLPAQPARSQDESTYFLQSRETPIYTASVANEPLYLDSDRSYSYDLRVREGTSFGDRYIPAGAIIRGNYEPVSGGLRYVAHSVSIGDRTYRFNASSDILRGHSSPNSKRAIAEDAGVGAVGSTVLQELFNHHHHVTLGGIFGGTVLGAAAGAVGSSAHRVVVVEPGMSIVLYGR